MEAQPPIQVVIFGASGDLTARKLVPALSHLAEKGSPAFQLVGVARRPMDDDGFRALLCERLAPEDQAAFAALSDRVHYISGDVGHPEDLERIRTALDALPEGSRAGRLFYLSLKPDLFIPAVESLGRAGMLKQSAPSEPWRRVIVEKPFGRDLASARTLDFALHAWLREDQIYRIDHYLGKETVQNLFALRFNNAIFEPLWNREHIELVQITVAEEVGMENGRAGYYDTVGALRDMVQNHMLQVLAMIAMEPPSSLDPETLRDQKVNVLKSLRLPADCTAACVHARYGAANGQSGYLEEPGVSTDSRTETYVALRLELDNWRWAGVPFLLRHGKRLKQRFTEVKVHFRIPPIQLFDRVDEAEPLRLADGTVCRLRPNHLTLSIQPREAMSLSFGVKAPGAGMGMVPAELRFDYKDRFGVATPPAYERLLLDAIQGDPTLFLRTDEVEAGWRFADALRARWEASDAGPLLEYPSGSWGPAEADALFRGCEGSWSRG
ncbi:MAG TPA: glucose-6-phosphate dehydrogenase [Holophaga sp.]|nr:glucose-6-phosphate dehydrogenase [Holophaga sp.]